MYSFVVINKHINSIFDLKKCLDFFFTEFTVFLLDQMNENRTNSLENMRLLVVHLHEPVNYINSNKKNLVISFLIALSN